MPSGRLLCRCARAATLLSVLATMVAVGVTDASAPERCGLQGCPLRSAAIAQPSVILRQPQAVAYDGASLIVADTGDARVLALDRDGASTRAGSGTTGFTGDGGRARDAELALPLAVSADGQGGVLVADTGNHRIRHVSASGDIDTVAGTGTSGFNGDQGSAVAAELSFPGGVAAHPDGGFVIADTGNNRVRRVSPAGIITTIAGGPNAAAVGAADEACGKPSAPSGLAVTAAGVIYFADTGANRVCRVDPNGRVIVVAGTGARDYTGDGASPEAAALARPTGLAVDDDGRLLIADTGNHVIRRIGLDKKIRTVAGSGTAGFAGDGGAATTAALNSPAGVATSDDGSFVIADTANDAVRRVAVDGSIETVLGNHPGRVVGAAATVRTVVGLRLVTRFSNRTYFSPPWPTARAGKVFAVSYVTPFRGVSSISILAGRRVVRSKRRKTEPGSGVVRFRGLRNGWYRIELTLRSGSRRSSVDARLHVLKRR